MLRDLPAGGRPIRLLLHLRRFFCKKNTCGQKIFAERLPSLWSRRIQSAQASSALSESTESGQKEQEELSRTTGGSSEESKVVNKVKSEQILRRRESNRREG
jgi:hypothetical protein